MSKLDKDSVLAKFTAAYEAANGKAPTIEAKGGWYSVDGGKNIRLAQLDEMADGMGAPAPKKADKPAKADKPKVAAKADKPKAPAKAKAKAKKPASSFSVKDFYTKQIQETNPGAKAPR
jgi:membrane protein involved in colicin uptake